MVGDSPELGSNSHPLLHSEALMLVIALKMELHGRNGMQAFPSRPEWLLHTDLASLGFTVLHLLAVDSVGSGLNQEFLGLVLVIDDPRY